MRLRLRGTEEEIMIFPTGRIPRLERSGNRGNEGSSITGYYFIEVLLNYLALIYLVTFEMVITCVTFLCKYYYYIIHYIVNYINISNSIKLIY